MKAICRILLIMLFAAACSGEKKEEGVVKTSLVDGGVEVSCTCNGKTVTKSCSVDGYCDCSGNEPRVVCCASSCTGASESLVSEVAFSNTLIPSPETMLAKGSNTLLEREYDQFVTDDELVSLEYYALQADGSHVYLSKDNYCPDQFYCVVAPYCYYRLTNKHREQAIAGFVRKSWVYNGRTYSQDVNFSLRPGDWQHFGCFFVTKTQPITFKIFSHFVTEENSSDLSAFNILPVSEQYVKDFGCTCPGGYPEGSFLCINSKLYRCISDPSNYDYCYWYNWGNTCP